MMELLIRDADRKPGDLIACTTTDGALVFLLLGYILPEYIIDELLPFICLN